VRVLRVYVCVGVFVCVLCMCVVEKCICRKREMVIQKSRNDVTSI
jgi:hypothetical protein